MASNSPAREPRSADKRLDKELKDTFPASDTPSVLRSPVGSDNGLNAARIDRRTPVTKPDDGKAREEAGKEEPGKEASRRKARI